MNIRCSKKCINRFRIGLWLGFMMASATGHGYIKNGGEGGNINDPAFWGLTEFGTSDYLRFHYSYSSPLALSESWTCSYPIQLYSYFNGELNFLGKTLSAQKLILVGEDAQVRFTGGTITGGTVQVYSSKNNFSNWRNAARLTVDGAQTRVEAYAALDYGPVEHGKGSSTITVQNGAVWRGAFRIGDNMPAWSNNVILVTGEGSRWEIPSGVNAEVGTGGASNLFCVVDGGTLVNDGTIRFGYDRGWNKGGGDFNALVVDAATLSSENGGIRSLGSSSNTIEIVNGSTATVSSIHLGWRAHYNGGRTYGNRLRVAGEGTTMTMIKMLAVGYENSDANEVIVEDGARLFATNSADASIRVGYYGNGFGNCLRVRSGAVVTASALLFGSSGQATGNRLEVENGEVYCNVRYPGSTAEPPLAFSNDESGEMVLRGTNSHVRASYFVSAPTLRFEIPDEGLAPQRATSAILHVSYVQVAPSAMEVVVSGNCPKGKWLLYSWNNSAKGETAEQIAQRVTLTGPGAGRSSIVTSENKVYLKVRSTDGILLIVR